MKEVPECSRSLRKSHAGALADTWYLPPLYRCYRCFDGARWNDESQRMVYGVELFCG